MNRDEETQEVELRLPRWAVSSFVAIGVLAVVQAAFDPSVGSILIAVALLLAAVVFPRMRIRLDNGILHQTGFPQVLTRRRFRSVNLNAIARLQVSRRLPLYGHLLYVHDTDKHKMFLISAWQGWPDLLRVLAGRIAVQDVAMTRTSRDRFSQLLPAPPASPSRPPPPGS